MEFSNSLWRAAIIPRNGWKNSAEKFIVKFAVSILLTLSGSLLLYNNIISRFKLKKQVIHDHLTGLYTGAFLDEFYQLAFEKGKRNNTKVLILLLDINKFKSINDTYGHKAGDEFLIIIPDIGDISDVKIIKERIRKAVTLDYHYQNKKIKILSSIGSAVYPTDETDFDKLTHFADEDIEDKFK